MTNQTNKPAPALPNGLVVVDKGSAKRQVQVGILTAGRMPAFGFDVSGSAPNHFRSVEHGKFGIVIGARSAVEVRVLLDNELLLETQLHPFDVPQGANIDPAVRRIMSESPQPHFLTMTAAGKPFTFATRETDLTPAEIIAEQIHPGRVAVAPTMDAIDRPGTPREQVKLDIDPADFGLAPPTPQAPLADMVVGSNLMGTAIAQLATANGLNVVNEQGQPVGDLEGQPAVMVKLAEDRTPAPKLPPLDPTMVAMSCAPSHGLVIIGVRMLQAVAEGETIPGAPDGFTYVLFQLNPWKLHTIAHSRLMGRVIMPSKEAMRALMEKEGFGHELSPHPEVSCCMTHKNPRR